ncbi:MAG: VanZ family protein [Burkholderiales bacterium]|jgi:VanZ family protein|nr:VanZ family protein [Burkholderiales bacterium]
MQDTRYFRLWQAIGVLMVLVVCIASLSPTMPPPPGLHGDKVEHLIAYGSLTYWWGMLYPERTQRWLACLLFILMGIGLEFAQRATGYRVLDVFDMAANTVGALLGRIAVETPFGRLLGMLDRRLA